MTTMTIAHEYIPTWGYCWTVKTLYGERSYFDYSKKEAEARYRSEFNLRGKRFRKVYRDWSTPEKKSADLMDAVKRLAELERTK